MARVGRRTVSGMGGEIMRRRTTECEPSVGPGRDREEAVYGFT